MKKYTAVLLVGVITLVLLVGVVAAAFPASTNDANRSLGWAHVNEVGVDIGEVTLEFISTRSFWSCFEYRTDGDTSQVISENGGVNYNTDITDGLYPYYCQNNNGRTVTIDAHSYVEIRMGFGAESDERFDWTRFDVLDAETKEDCKNGGWEAYGFNNQGLCIQYINTGKDSR